MWKLFLNLLKKSFEHFENEQKLLILQKYLLNKQFIFFKKIWKRY
jgi:hypothetical protein